MSSCSSAWPKSSPSRTHGVGRMRRMRGRSNCSDGEDFLTMPIEVLACRKFGTGREQNGLQQRWAPVVLPGEIISADGVSQRRGDVDLQLRADGQESSVECHVVAGASGQAVLRI